MADDDTASRAAAMRIQCDLEGRAKMSDEPSDYTSGSELYNDFCLGDTELVEDVWDIYNAGKEASRASMQRELEEARARIAALEAGQDYCWHCRVGLIPAAKRCERCPAPGDCDDEDCEAEGCAEAKAPREAELVTSPPCGVCGASGIGYSVSATCDACAARKAAPE